MPLVRRKRPLDMDGGALETRISKRLKTGNKELCQFDNIGYRQDHYHSLHLDFPENEGFLELLLAKETGSFLNSKGGILCLGCRKNGCVYGYQVNRKEEDNIKLVIDNVFKRFRPIVEPKQYRVTFTTLKERYGTFEGRKVVIEIRIQAGDQFEMYEDLNHETYLRKNDAPYGPLTPHEIKRLTTQQLRQKLKAIKPIQNVLSTPKNEKPTLATAFNIQNVVTKPRTKFRFKIRKQSSGSDEDPISVAVVKPLNSSEAKSSSSQSSAGNEDTTLKKPTPAKSTTAPSSETKNDCSTPLSKATTIPPSGGRNTSTIAAPVVHPLSQSIKATRPLEAESGRSQPSTEDTGTALKKSNTALTTTNAPSTDTKNECSTPRSTAIPMELVTTPPSPGRDTSTTTVPVVHPLAQSVKPATSLNCRSLTSHGMATRSKTRSLDNSSAGLTTKSIPTPGNGSSVGVPLKATSANLPPAKTGHTKSKTVPVSRSVAGTGPKSTSGIKTVVTKPIPLKNTSSTKQPSTAVASSNSSNTPSTKGKNGVSTTSNATTGTKIAAVKPMGSNSAIVTASKMATVTSASHGIPTSRVDGSKYVVNTPATTKTAATTNLASTKTKTIPTNGSTTVTVGTTKPFPSSGTSGGTSSTATKTIPHKPVPAPTKTVPSKGNTISTSSATLKTASTKPVPSISCSTSSTATKIKPAPAKGHNNMAALTTVAPRSVFNNAPPPAPTCGKRIIPTTTVWYGTSQYPLQRNSHRYLPPPPQPPRPFYNYYHHQPYNYSYPTGYPYNRHTYPSQQY